MYLPVLESFHCFRSTRNSHRCCCMDTQSELLWMRCNSLANPSQLHPSAVEWRGSNCWRRGCFGCSQCRGPQGLISRPPRNHVRQTDPMDLALKPRCTCTRLYTPNCRTAPLPNMFPNMCAQVSVAWVSYSPCCAICHSSWTGAWSSPEGEPHKCNGLHRNLGRLCR